MIKLKEFLRKSWIWILAVILVLAVILSSVEIYKEEVLNIDPDIKYTEKKTLYFAAQRFDTLNPLVSQSEDTYYLSKLIYDSLFDFDENLNVVPKLVDTYRVDTEKACVKIRLKRGIKWHNGGKLTASDVRFTVNAVKQAGSKSPYYEKCAKIMYVNVNGNSDLTIYFNNNYNCSLDMLTFPIVSSTGYSSPYQFASDRDKFKPNGTGLYKYSSYDYLKRLKLKPNEDYFNNTAEKKIQVNLLPNAGLASAMTEINEVTCYIDKDTDRRSIVKDKNLTMYDMISNQLEFLVFNTKKPYWSDKQVRQAAAYGIDTEKILNNAYAGDAVQTDTIYYPNFLGDADTNELYGYDPEKALDLLCEAGLEDKNGNGLFEDAYGKNVTVSILVNKKNAQRMTAAKLISNNLETLGFKANINALAPAEYKKAIASRQFDILIAGYAIEETYDLREFFNGKNAWGYYNADLFTKSRELERLYDADTQKEKYSELKDALQDEMPYYALCYKKMGLIGISGFTAEKLPMFNDIYKNCDTWSWKVEVKQTKNTK